MSQIFRIPVISFRRVETPYEQIGKQSAVAIVRISDLPELDDWRKVNPRRANKRTHVYKAIKSSLQEENQDFIFMNRGLVISAANYQFDNRKGILTVHFEDLKAHGLLDGGHTYEAIHEIPKELLKDQYIKVEFLMGFNRIDINAVVRARNTSTQVKEISLINLHGNFEHLKEVLADKRYANEIAYRENEPNLPIDIRQLISFLYLFDITHHEQYGKQPVRAYWSKEHCLKHFTKHKDRLEEIYGIADDVFRLWDSIHLYLPDLYKRVTKGDFERLAGIQKKEEELYFIGETSDWYIPDAMKYPILAAFRAFVEKDTQTGMYRWSANIKPFEILQDKLGEDLVVYVARSLKDTRNANKTGKDENVWKSCYLAADNVYLRKRLEKSETS